MVEEDDGSQTWVFEGNRYPNVGLNAVVGRPREEWSMDPARFDEMRPGCFDIDARIEDMDRAGIWASLCFPSLVSGFCGAVYSRAQDKDLGLACLRAFNDWHLEVWAAYRARAHHPAAAALAGRRRRSPPRRCGPTRPAGFKAVSFPEFPARLQLPVHLQRRVGPLLRRLRGDRHRRVPAHRRVGLGTARRRSTRPSRSCPPSSRSTRCWPPASGCGRACRCASRSCNIALSEGGIGWVHDADGPGRLRARALGVGDREHIRGPPTCCRARCCGGTSGSAPSTTPPPSAQRHVIGVDHIMVESDYPHADSSWPDTQRVLAENWGALPDDELRAVAGGQRGPAVPPPAAAGRTTGAPRHGG